MSGRSKDASPEKGATVLESENTNEEAGIREKVTSSRNDKEMKQSTQTDDKRPGQQESERSQIARPILFFKEYYLSDDGTDTSIILMRPLTCEELGEFFDEILRAEKQFEEEFIGNDENRNSIHNKIKYSVMESRGIRMIPRMHSKKEEFEREESSPNEIMNEPDTESVNFREAHIGDMVERMDIGEPNKESQRSFDENRVEAVQKLMDLLSSAQDFELPIISSFLQSKTLGVQLNERLLVQIKEHVIEYRDRMISKIADKVAGNNALTERDKEIIYDDAFVEFHIFLLCTVEVVMKYLKKLNFGRFGLRAVFKKKRDQKSGEMVDCITKLVPVQSNELSTEPESSESDSRHSSTDVLSDTSDSDFTNITDILSSHESDIPTPATLPVIRSLAGRQRLDSDHSTSSSESIPIALSEEIHKKSPEPSTSRKFSPSPGKKRKAESIQTLKRRKRLSLIKEECRDSSGYDETSSSESEDERPQNKQNTGKPKHLKEDL